MKDKKSYYAIIPAGVRYSDIPPNAKLLYGEITALANEKGYCWASNKYFAELYKVKERTVTGWVASLIEKGFIKSEVSKEDDKYGRKIFLEGVEDLFPKKTKEGRKKVLHNTTDNIIYNNTTNIADKSANPVKVKIDFQSKLSSIAVSEDLKERIVGVYWQKKGITFRNNLTYDKALKRLKKTAGELIGYEGEDILGLMTQLQAQSHNVDWEWKLTTVVKKIDDFIAKKNRKNN